ncbi:MAG: enoyl-CoA hydratase/isomerase family protein [Euryarchaeota archaeon]|nr:enoyl-CoA hydratase/isomerase family protein [Euryarchaeota archaeon]
MVLYACLRVEKKGKVSLVTLHRPEKRNALSIQMREELTRLLGEAAGDKGVGALVFTGAGPAFCAGFDLSEFQNPDPAHKKRLYESSAAYHRALWNFPRPTLAAVNGPALGGGMDLALLCDLRLASPEARFGQPNIKFGAPPLATPLRHIVGEGHARDLCLSGRKIDAQEAHRIGLVSEVTPPDRLVERTLERANEILQAPPAALAETKKMFLLGFEECFQREHDEVFRRFFLGVG